MRFEKCAKEYNSSGESNLKKSTRSESDNPQAMRDEVTICLKSLDYDLKPDDLTLSKVKRSQDRGGLKRSYVQVLF